MPPLPTTSPPPALSLVVATRGRADPFGALFASLEAQTFRDFEVIVVDQNADGRVGTPDADGWSFPVTHVRTPGESGASRARNVGWAEARGAIVLFPDDDCWYGPGFLAHAIECMRWHDADVLAGRAADESGHDINGRFEKAVVRIDRRAVWTTGIEWVVFFKRGVLEAVEGYDVEIGIGAATPWQACEAQDIMLRAIAAGFACVFDPSVYGHHARLDVRTPAMLRKGRAYARGHGYVLRRHGYSIATVASWIVRPFGRAVLSLSRGDTMLFNYCLGVALGRFEGWQGKTIDSHAAADSTAGLSAIRS